MCLHCLHCVYCNKLTLCSSSNEMRAGWWWLYLQPSLGCLSKGSVNSVLPGSCDALTSSLVFTFIENWFFFFLLWLFLKYLKNKHRKGTVEDLAVTAIKGSDYALKTRLKLTFLNKTTTKPYNLALERFRGWPLGKLRVTLRNGWKEIWKGWQIV